MTSVSEPPVKLTGRAFYESIGSPRVVLAPMVDQSEYAWRRLTRSFFQHERLLLAYTPMFHARLFAETQRFRDHHFQPQRPDDSSKRQARQESSSQPTLPSKETRVSPDCPIVSEKKRNGSEYLDGNPKDRPLIVQFCANDPEQLLEAARHVQPYCDAVDLNLGCPQGIARKGRYGAFLQEDPDLIYRLVNILHRKLDIPVTAKMRILDTKAETLKYAQMLLSAGASIITVHGRRREQKGHQTGLADWESIRHLRQNLPPETVIFANGNILQYRDIQRCLDYTGADAVMSAEGNLYDPGILAPPNMHSPGYWQGRNGIGGYRVDFVFRKYMDILYREVLEMEPPSRDGPMEEPPPRKRKSSSERTTSPNLMAMQAHLFHLLRFLVSRHTNIRDRLAQCRAGDLTAFEYVLRMTETAVGEGLAEYERDPAFFDEAESREERARQSLSDVQVSSLEAVRACKRPWWICQPYVRPLPAEALGLGALTAKSSNTRRQQVDKADGLPSGQVPSQAMVAG